jgi:hypothetical protein
MLPTTLEVIRSTLRTDPTLTPRERAGILAQLRNRQSPSPAPAVRPAILRPAVAGERLSRTVRSIHQLCQEGLLQKIWLPGRKRAAGISAESVAALIAGGQKGGAA